jgi:ring-1,2-phenylacetyl-CoA epoxidase subunit PaaE
MTPASALAALASLATVDSTDYLARTHHRRFRDYLDRWPDPPPDPTPDDSRTTDIATALATYQKALGALVASPDAGLAGIAHRCLIEVQVTQPDHVVDAGFRPTYALPVRDVRSTGRDGIRIELELPIGLRERFRHSAGQHVKVVHSSGGVMQHRSYSLCTGPTSVAATGRLVLGVRALPDGFVSATLTDPPEELWVSPPHGSLAWSPGDGRRLVLCGIGSGVTPVLAITDEALRVPGRNVDLLLIDRGPDEAMLLSEALALAAEHPGRLTVHTLWTRVPRRRPLTAARVAARLAEIAPDRTTSAYVCGAGEPVRLVVEQLEAQGVSEIHHESFDTSRRARVETPPRPGGTVTVDAGGGPLRVDVGPGESVLVALIGLGREPAYSCLAGTCGECEVTLVAGAVAPADTTAEPGRIRTCITAPAPVAD